MKDQLVTKDGPTGRYAIYFSISDSYSFAIANVIMGLKKYSPALMDLCDIIVYHTGISNENIGLLRKLHENTYFREMVFPEEYNVILEHKTAKVWGPYVVAKFAGFDLIHEYEKALFLDADLLIRDDISPIFALEEEIAWCNILAWDIKANFASLLRHPDDYISAGNAGLYYFSDKLKKYGITSKSIVSAFETVKGLKRGGSDELVMAWIVYENKMSLKELERDIWNIPARRAKPESKILHFLDHMNVSTKPWKNLAAYLYFTEWRDRYQQWLDMGGKGLANFTEKDHYALFGFDQREKIQKLETTLKAKASFKLEDYLQLQKEHQKLQEEHEKLQAKYDKVIDSVSWRFTKPFRVCANKLRDLMKKVRSCFKK